MPGNKPQPSLIFPSGSRLRRSASSVSSSLILNSIRPKSLVEVSVPKRHSDNYNPYCTVKKKNLCTIEEKSASDENDCYILRIGCHNWVGRWEQYDILITFAFCCFARDIHQLHCFAYQNAFKL